MGQPPDGCALTAEERHLLSFLRHGPQSVTAMAEALRLSPEQIQDALQRLDAKVGLVRLCRYETPRYGLAE